MNAIALAAPGRHGLVRAFAACAGWLALSAWLGSSRVFAAGIIEDANGFETPTFSTTFTDGGTKPAGTIHNQHGWKQGTGNGANTAIVQSTLVRNGTQAVRLTRAAGGVDGFWAVPNLTGYPTGRFALIDWDMRVEQSFPGGVGVGPFFGVQANALPGATFSVLATLGVDATSGQVLYQRALDGAVLNVGPFVAFGAWNHFRIQLDFNLHKYALSMNGTPLISEEFVDQDQPGGLNALSDADLATFAVLADAASQNATGTGYIDNFILRDGIPGDFNQDGYVTYADLNLWKSSVGVNAAADGDGDLDSDGADFLIWQQNLAGSQLPGDFQHDGDVDAADLTVWKSSLGLNASGDANGDGITDGADLAIWQRYLGSVSPPATAALGAVPEPGAIGMLLFAGGALAAAVKRRMA